MATIDDKDFIDRLIANDGHYDDDPQVLVICSYRTVEGKLTWSVAWTEADLVSLRTSPFVRDIRMIWRRGIERRECVECGELAELDGMGCCSIECDIAHEKKHPGCCDGPDGE